MTAETIPDDSIQAIAPQYKRGYFYCAVNYTPSAVCYSLAPSVSTQPLYIGETADRSTMVYLVLLFRTFDDVLMLGGLVGEVFRLDKLSKRVAS